MVGVSASPCLLRFRRKAGEGHETRALELAPRSVYVLEGPARREWQHGDPGDSGDAVVDHVPDGGAGDKA